MLNGWFVKIVLIACLISNIFVLYFLLRIDYIVHNQLYSYGLHFSLDWAASYWAFLNVIFAFLAVPIILSVAYFGLEVLRFIKRGKVVQQASVEATDKPAVKSVKTEETNHMLVNCPKCRRVFSKPLVMLDFTDGKTKLVNVCPYCNHVLGCAEMKVAEKEKNNATVFVDLDKKEVRQK